MRMVPALMEDVAESRDNDAAMAWRTLLAEASMAAWRSLKTANAIIDADVSRRAALARGCRLCATRSGAGNGYVPHRGGANRHFVILRW